jgi:hypothetical protein
MHKFLFLALSLLLFAAPAAAGDSCAAAHVPRAKITGQGAMKVAFWHVYDAALYVPGGKYSPGQPHALKLIYRQKIKGKKIAEISAQEMRKNGLKDKALLTDWSAKMEKIFPDVRPGDSLTGVYTGNQTIFCQDGRKLGGVQGHDFARHFFGIWLSEKTTAPELRRQLLGQP